MPRSPVAVALCVGLAACSGAPRGHLRGATFTRGDERFHVQAPGPPWLRLDAPGDLAWSDPRTHAVVAANATCHAHGDSPLPVLQHDLLLGTTDRRPLLEERVTLDGREAAHAVVLAKLDGVPLVYDLYVYKKDGCVYDLSLISPPASYDAVSRDFQRFVADFHAPRRLR